ncbi:MAG TPA: RNA polymerase sigma factor, partial [Saprospiraceae bacterium]|nr:RNA polymerase sigma factor [Saprospiraceae bacterium]
KTWINKIAINHSIDALRKKKVIFGELHDHNYSIPDGKAEDDDFELKVQDVKNAIMSLPAGYRAVVSLYLLEGLPQEEIGKILGISHSTVRTQYKKAKEKIWQQLKNNTYHE